MKKVALHLFLVSLTFFTFSCSSDDDNTIANSAGITEKSSKIIQVSNGDGEVSVDLKLSSYDQAKLEAFLNSYEYILTEESITKNSDTTALEQEFIEQAPIDNSLSSIENEVIGSIPDGYLITLQEKTPQLRYGISGNIISISLRKTNYGSSYYYWNGARYLAGSTYYGWVGHPRNGVRTYKTASFNSSIFTQWSIRY